MRVRKIKVPLSRWVSSLPRERADEAPLNVVSLSNKSTHHVHDSSILGATMASQKLVFVTGNAMKLKEVQEILNAGTPWTIQLESRSFDSQFLHSKSSQIPYELMHYI